MINLTRPNAEPKHAAPLFDSYLELLRALSLARTLTPAGDIATAQEAAEKNVRIYLFGISHQAVKIRLSPNDVRSSFDEWAKAYAAAKPANHLMTDANRYVKSIARLLESPQALMLARTEVKISLADMAAMGIE